MALVVFILYDKNKTDTMFLIMKELETAEAQLAESKLAADAMQIKPHFIYNTLNSIMELCYSEPQRAAEAIGRFSSYLQGISEFFKAERLTVFDKELELIKGCIDIERIDTNKVFKIKYDLEITDFEIPPLSVQPLVENAIKHGIDRYSPDSLVRIATRKDENAIYIEVSDNGTAGTSFDKEPGIGLSNITRRLKILLGGELVVKRGENGVTATIILPQK